MTGQSIRATCLYDGANLTAEMYKNGFAYIRTYTCSHLPVELYEL
jgi:hypothetical protein